MTKSDFERLEHKIDLLLDAMGLRGKSRYAPKEIDCMVEADILKFRKKQARKGHERA
jgi:hypothetical protein